MLPIMLAVWIAAALSGAAALAYEICWSRALVVPLGNSMDAAAIVLAGFMLGIGVGARLGGGWAERVVSPLKAYALVELLLGAYALAAPWLLSVLSSVGPVPLRYLAALSLITLPGLAMGTSLPLLVRALTSARQPLAHHISILYGANTLGASIGACVIGFWGIALVGVWRSSIAAALASVAAAAIAMSVSRRFIVVKAERQGETPSREHRQIALVGAFVSGMAMLACEMLWARLLTFVFGHDTYAFATLLAIVLLGLAIGGFLHRLLAGVDQARLLGVLLACFGLTVLGSFWVSATLVIEAGRDPFGLQGSGSFATSVWLEFYRELTFTPVLVLLPAVVSGAIYPTACSLYAGGAEDSGRSVGVVGLVNGVGSALGALLAAFGLITAAGMQIAFVLIALLCGAVASFILIGRRAEFLPFAAVWMLAMALPHNLPRRMLLQPHGARHWTLLFYEEARTGTVSVIESSVNGERQLLMNGINEVTTRLVHDQSFKVLGHLAPLLHPNPRKGLMICLGAGLSAGSAVTHPLEWLDVVDLSSTVARGARYFALQNNGVLDDPKFRFHIGDGRQFLLNTAERYDVAIIDSTHPKAVDSWILYTKEFYQLLRDRLATGGIAVQWLPLHGLSEREFKIVVRTFLEAFPDMTLWANVGIETYGQVAYAKLVGRKDAPNTIDVARLQQRLAEPRVHADLSRYGISSVVELLDLFLSDAAGVVEWTDGLPLQTDDHPLVPYTTRYAQGRRMQPPLLLGVRKPITPLLANVPAGSLDDLDAAYEAQGMVLAGKLDRAAEIFPNGRKIRLYREQRSTTQPFYASLSELYADDPDKLFEFGTQLGSLGFPAAALPVFLRALSLRPDDFKLRLNLALLRLGAGDVDAALASLAQLRVEQPRSAIVLHNLGAAVLASGDPSVAAMHLADALARDPSSIAAALSLGRAYLAADDLHKAHEVALALVTHNRFVGEAHDLLGLIAMTRNDHAAAVVFHERAIALLPYSVATHYNSGLALQAGDLDDRAASAYRAALRIDPAHLASLNNLGVLEADAGRFDRAADLHLLALDADPNNAIAALNLGRALRGQGRPKEALGALCLALRLDPALAPARQQLLELGQRCDEL
jgi:spermidine synthase